MTTPLARIYASAPGGVFPIYTVEIQNETWAEPIRFAQSETDVVATLETDEVVTFRAAGVALRLPERGVKGKEDFEFQLDNVTAEASSAIESARRSGKVSHVILRTYASDDLSAPATEPVTFFVVGARANRKSVNVLASMFGEFINKAWPDLRYTLDLTPGLKYVGD